MLAFEQLDPADVGEPVVELLVVQVRTDPGFRCELLMVVLQAWLFQVG